MYLVLKITGDCDSVNYSGEEMLDRTPVTRITDLPDRGLVKRQEPLPTARFTSVIAQTIVSKFSLSFSQLGG